MGFLKSEILPSAIDPAEQVALIDPKLEYAGAYADGSIVRVYRVVDTLSSRIRALKVFNHVDPWYQRLFNRDRVCISLLTERQVEGVPHIHRTYGSAHAFLVDYIPHSVWNAKRRSREDYEKLMSLFIEIVKGGVGIPRDCHDRNIVMGKDGNPKVIDFGEAVLNPIVPRAIGDAREKINTIRQYNKRAHGEKTLHSLLSAALRSI